MTKKFTFAVCLCALMSVCAFAKDNSMTGWVSDSKCAAKGSNASHADCAKKCVEGGAKPVFVSDKDGKIMNIDNPDAVKDHIGDHVQMKGSMSNGGVHVASVAIAEVK